MADHPRLISVRAVATAKAALVLIVLANASCGGEIAAGGGWQGQREVRGDTVIVTTTGGSVWPAPARLVEELRIGVLDGPEELIFGFINELAPDADGGVYVFDAQVPALRYYDAAGNYVRTLGGSGSGPGEYRDAALGLAVRSDGRIVMRDPRNNRLNVYEADGTPFEHWPVGSNLFTGNAMVLDTADHMYLRASFHHPSGTSRGTSGCCTWTRTEHCSTRFRHPPYRASRHTQAAFSCRRKSGR